MALSPADVAQRGPDLDLFQAGAMHRATTLNRHPVVFALEIETKRGDHELIVTGRLR